ncbi:hypothetical protein KMW28_23335 [Flammeovirga yaeyamensis]|uniref:Beta-agarase n=1 Tax=Flammeovirga yaeyamensis TaxID=367791 RepID=A0AAX1NFI3_9BACT|nr:hypothetical protein [Flammeovirga yaeyamensis]MBB3696697.1 hypothetical protein [Flammeovirga yaeyamensis]NMF33368.1 hypothetical protein [Flammeovirga yaeyamensis]QWG05358.1 hypothetical protein KMW28_23335 [Flammeovirga yaeyamensis]
MRTTILILSLMYSFVLTAQDKAKVTFDPSTKMSYDGVTKFERKNFINVHTTYEHIPQQFRKELYEELGVSDGRSFGLGTPSNKLSGTNHKHPGTFSEKALKAEMKEIAANSTPRKFEDEIIVTSHPGSYFPVGEFVLEKKKEQLVGIPAIEEYFQQRLRESTYRKGYIEILNEPFVHDRDMHTSVDTIIDMFKYTAKAIHQKYPQAKVGGPGHAWPAYELNDFQIWKERMGKFIEVAGNDMDFLSVHLYSTYYDDKASYRAGANAEAILDMIEAKSLQVTGTIKPLVISEYGSGFKKGTNIVQAYYKERDWYVIHGVNSKMMQFMNRPHRIVKSVPFICGRADWYDNEHPYPWVLFHKKNNEYQKTELIKFYQFWKDVKGEYVFIQSDHADVQTVGFREGNKVFICLDNLEDKTIDVDLAGTGFKHQKAELRRIYSEGNGPILSQQPISDISKITLSSDETAILILELNDDTDEFSSTIKLTEQYHPETIQKIGQQEKEYQFDVNPDELVFVDLHLGIARPIAEDFLPIVKLNGQKISVSRNQMGRTQDFKELTFENALEPKIKRPQQQNFFGVHKIALPKALLKEKNVLSLSFEKGEGFISTVKVVQGHQSEMNQ